MECAQPGSSVHISVSLQIVSVPGSIVDSGSAKSATSLNAEGGLMLSKQSLALLVRTLVDMAATYTSAMMLAAGFISSNMPSLFPGDCSDADWSLVELSATSEVMLATLTILFSMSTISINSSIADGGLMLSRWELQLLDTLVLSWRFSILPLWLLLPSALRTITPAGRDFFLECLHSSRIPLLRGWWGGRDVELWCSLVSALSTLSNWPERLVVRDTRLPIIDGGLIASRSTEFTLARLCSISSADGYGRFCPSASTATANLPASTSIMRESVRELPCRSSLILFVESSSLINSGNVTAPSSLLNEATRGALVLILGNDTSLGDVSSFHVSLCFIMLQSLFLSFWTCTPCACCISSSVSWSKEAIIASGSFLFLLHSSTFSSLPESGEGLSPDENGDLLSSLGLPWRLSALLLRQQTPEALLETSNFVSCLSSGSVSFLNTSSFSFSLLWAHRWCIDSWSLCFS